MLGTRQGYSVQKWVAGTLGALFIGVAAAHEVMPRSGIVQKAVVDAAAAGVTAAELARRAPERRNPLCHLGARRVDRDGEGQERLGHDGLRPRLVRHHRRARAERAAPADLRRGCAGGR